MNRKITVAAVLVLLLLVIAALLLPSGKAPAPAETPVPTATAAPTATPVPTATPGPESNTPAPTDTPAPVDTQTTPAAPLPSEIPGGEDTPGPAETPLPESPAVRDVLLRMDEGYDPATGSVVALRWASRLLDAYRDDGRDPASAGEEMRALAASGADAAAWEQRLERLRWAALRIASGEVAGLISEHHAPETDHWTAAEVEEFFDALSGGLS